MSAAPTGELIPIENESGETQFARDAAGQFVKSRLDETMLRQIAEATGAMYQPLGQQAQGLDAIYSQGLAKFTRHELASRMQKIYLERFQWPLALGLLCLMAEPLIGIRRRTREEVRRRGASRPGRFVESHGPAGVRPRRRAGGRSPSGARLGRRGGTGLSTGGLPPR